MVNEPFAVINANDFYGRDSFAVLGKELSAMTGKRMITAWWAIVNGNTLSESGSVARGVCRNKCGRLSLTVVERTAIERIDGKVSLLMRMVNWCRLRITHRSLYNMWGFTPIIFSIRKIISLNSSKENMGNLKAEYFIPLMVNN